MSTDDTPRAATLEDVVAALGALTAALTPALTPATRPAFDQLRWSPSAEAFGELDAGVFAAVDAGGWPTAVAPDQLIESAWGNAVVAGLGKVAVGGGVLRVGPHLQGPPGTVLHNPVAPVLPYATRMVVNSTVYVGSDTTAVPGVAAATITQIAGQDQPMSPPVTSSSGGGSYAMVALVWSWVVPANGSPQYATNCTWGGAPGGAMYSAADTTWVRYRS